MRDKITMKVCESAYTMCVRCVTCLDLRRRNPICPPSRGEVCLCGQTANTASERADINVKMQGL